MLYQVTCNTTPSVDLAHYGVSRVEDLGILVLSMGIWEMYCNFCLLRCFFFIKGENLRIRLFLKNNATRPLRALSPLFFRY